MKKVIFITAVNEKEIYKKCVLDNVFVKNDSNIETICLDNTIENKYISVRYNEFLDRFDYSGEAWLVFCHSDWEIKENIGPRLEKLDRNFIYGPIGVAVTSNKDGVITREYKGRIFDKKRDGTNERLMECDVFNSGALVDTFDCQCMIVHSSLIHKYNLKFDNELEFDFYVEDFCLAAKIKHNIDSHILNIDCCHWQQLNDIKCRPHFFDKADYINEKYYDYLFGAVIIPIGKNKGVAIKEIADIAPTISHVENRSEVYHSEVDISNKYDARVIAINYIDKNSYVLDVGCACGDFGKALKKVSDCSIVGMEYDQESIEIAKKTGGYENIIQIDLNNFVASHFENLEKKFDYIVFGDVLEHVYKPQQVLDTFKYFLKDKGFFIISLPNIAHASIKSCLLNDEFIYTDTGILDETHVKFFTHKSFASFFGDISMEINELKFTPLEAMGFLVNDPYATMSDVVKNYIFSDPHSFVCQYVMKIKMTNDGKSHARYYNEKIIQKTFYPIPEVLSGFMDKYMVQHTDMDLLKNELRSANRQLMEARKERGSMVEEIGMMKKSKFWKLRTGYLGLKFIIFSPGKFFKKYLNKLS